MATREKNGKEDEQCKRETAEPKAALKITPVGRKIGESRDNLQKRGEWFRRRSGSSS